MYYKELRRQAEKEEEEEFKKQVKPQEFSPSSTPVLCTKHTIILLTNTYKIAALCTTTQQMAAWRHFRWFQILVVSYLTSGTFMPP